MMDKARRKMIKHIINQYYAGEMLVSLLENNYTENEICGEILEMIKKIREQKKNDGRN